MIRIFLSFGAIGLLGACSVKTTTVERREPAPAPATVVTSTPATTTYSTTTPAGTTSTTVVR